jgi:HSP20 family protein
MSKKDIKVELDGNVLTIRSEKVNEQTNKDDVWYNSREFSYQSFQRSFNLQRDVVDADKIEAKYEDGVLHLLIPKKEEAKQAKPRLINIS